jgi:hypothetical protein
MLGFFFFFLNEPSFFTDLLTFMELQRLVSFYLLKFKTQ